MKELTDLEICKRIAKIDGVVVYRETKDFYGDNYFRDDTHHDLAPVVYNPLTDDALCFQLMVKYKIKLCWEYDETWLCYKNGFSILLSKDESPNKALCLAIIELDVMEKELEANK